MKRYKPTSFDLRLLFNSILSVREARRSHVIHTRPLYADVHPYARYALVHHTHALCATYTWRRMFMPTRGRE